MLESAFQVLGCKLLAGGALAKPVAPARRIGVAIATRGFSIEFAVAVGKASV
jgi:hypothetical protein